MSHDYELDMLGAIHNNSKSSLSHNYLELYGFFFRPFKDYKINIIELGVQDGYSIDLWLEYFAKATIIGVDWTPAAVRFARDRAVIKIGRQDDPEFLETVSKEFPPTIVIDDCSHLAHQTMMSLEILFRTLVPGGIYVIEDLFFQRPDIAEFYKGAPTAQNPIDFLKRHSAYLLGGFYTGDQVCGFDTYFHQHIDFITAINGAAILGKKGRPDIADRAIFDAGELLASKKGTALAWSRFAAFVRRHNGPDARVESAVRRAISNDPSLSLSYLELADLYGSKGRFKEAVDALTPISSLRPEAFEVWRARGLYLMHLGQLEEAEENLKRAAKLNDLDYWTMKHLSDVLERSGRFAEAVDAARTALELGKKEVPSYLGQHLERLEKAYKDVLSGAK